MKIAVGLSGGVDSAVAALLLREAGHEVFAVTMSLWPEGGGTLGKERVGAGTVGASRPSGNACFGPDESEDIEAARCVCGILGIPHYVFDCSRLYERLVLRNFREEYRLGRTPNPCVRCNRMLKFGLLPELAERSGLTFDRFATGHYARTGLDPDTGRFLLRKSLDGRRDQSYFLYGLSQSQLAGTLFPLGDLTKEQVRRLAADAGLPVKDKKDSQDFYGGDLSDLLGRGEEGEIVDGRGRVLGKHRGISRYTIGQRRGLGLSSSVPLYVVAVDAAANRLVVGPVEETFSRTCTVSSCRWISGEEPAGVLEAEVKIRSSGPPVEASISPLGGGRARVDLRAPRSSVAPGQSAVFYRGDIVLGGGIMEAPEDPAERVAKTRLLLYKSGHG